MKILRTVSLGSNFTGSYKKESKSSGLYKGQCARHRNQSIDFQCKSIDWFLYKLSVILKWIKLVKKMSRIFCYYDDKQF